jgi:predicted regulator of Ras-like GTPase activity (Roadblock/LC7/MglB family)
LGEQDDVEVEAVAVQGQQVSAALVDAAKDAELLVVGSGTCHIDLIDFRGKRTNMTRPSRSRLAYLP